MMRYLFTLTMGLLGCWPGTAPSGYAQSPTAGPAVRDARLTGKALCKVISPTDAGVSQSNQAGLYLPKPAWRFFAATAPVEEENHREPVEITWPDGRKTEAIASWYGRGSRSKFRLTRLTGQLTSETVGDLLVLVPQGSGKYLAHLLRTEDDAAEFYSALGIESGQPWGFTKQLRIRLSPPAPSGSGQSARPRSTLRSPPVASWRNWPGGRCRSASRTS